MSQLPLLVLALLLLRDADSVDLWGSRIIAKPSGPSDTMHLGVLNDSLYDVTFDKGIKEPGPFSSELTVMNGNCIVQGKVWGAPCAVSADGVTITTSDVTAQRSILAVFTNIEAGLFFVPYCDFTTPKLNQLDLGLSFPFTRLMGGSEYVLIDFGVKGVSLNTEVNLVIDGEKVCIWDGIQLFSGSCSNLEVDEASDLKVYHGNFSRKDGSKRNSYLMHTRNDIVVVNVDWEQTGEPPDYAECAKYQTTKTTTKSTPTTTTTTTTMSQTTTPSTSRTTVTSGSESATTSSFACIAAALLLLGVSSIAVNVS